MAGRAGRAGRPRGRAEHLARGRRTAETEGGLGCGGLVRPGEGRRRRGAADELDGRRARLDDEAGREAVGDGGWARVRRRRRDAAERRRAMRAGRMARPGKGRR